MASEDLGAVAGEAVADMFAQSAIRSARQSCECEYPMPGVFDHFYWTTCQRCCKQLSLRQVAEKRPYGA